jgi:hypothetical protein
MIITIEELPDDVPPKVIFDSDSFLPHVLRVGDDLTVSDTKGPVVKFVVEP